MNRIILSDDQKIELFLDWFNNFLTVERFAEHYLLTQEQAKWLIAEGRQLHEAKVTQSKQKIKEELPWIV